MAVNRTEWVTYENIEIMYDPVYEKMVRAGVAKVLALEDYYYVNSKGQRVSTKEESIGSQVKLKSRTQSRSYLEMRWGPISVRKFMVTLEKFVTAKGTSANVKSSHKDGRMTVIGLTAASGNAVMAIIIFAAEELTLE